MAKSKVRPQPKQQCWIRRSYLLPGAMEQLLQILRCATQFDQATLIHYFVATGLEQEVVLPKEEQTTPSASGEKQATGISASMRARWGSPFTDAYFTSEIDDKVWLTASQLGCNRETLVHHLILVGIKKIRHQFVADERGYTKSEPWKPILLPYQYIRPSD